jgi:hypothetical protein
MYQRTLPHQIKHLAVQPPETTAVVPPVSADYLQKMLAYMVFHEKPFFVQPLEDTHRKLDEINLADISPMELGRQLGVQGLLRFDFFDWIKADAKIKGFTFSISLHDLTQGKIVWQVVREFRGSEDLKSLTALKQYIQSKVKDESKTPFFAELYTILKDAFQSLPAPNYTDEELTERLLSTEEPF